MTHRHIEINNLMLDYHSKRALAEEVFRLRGVTLYLLFAACSGWGLLIWKCCSAGGAK